MMHPVVLSSLAWGIVLQLANPAAPPPAPADKKVMAAPPPSPDDYRVGAGDKLRIEVYKDAQLSQSLQVRPDGKITIPLVGELEASGRTPLELRDMVTRQLKEYINNPVVTVIVTEASGAVAYVSGEVSHPGAINMQGGRVTVLQAIALAGGLKDFADTKNILVLRQSGTSIEKIHFDYKDAIRGGGTPIYLRPGDTVVIPD
jgi:polysaccharide biosynthesis/export protein